MNEISGKTSFRLKLPAAYDVKDVIAFHGRDPSRISENVAGLFLKKGIVLKGIAIVLDLKFDSTISNVRCNVIADGLMTPEIKLQSHEIVLHILGLKLDAATFRIHVAKDPIFSDLVANQSSLRIIQSASIFEALTWAIMGQQINVSFAVSLRRTFIELSARKHSSGLYCFPEPEDVAKLTVEQLTSRKFSKAKAETLLRLANLLSNSKLDLAVSESNTIEQISAALLKIKGIGPWTVNYALLRGYGYADCSLHGDVAIRTAIHNLIGCEQRPTIAEAEEFLKQYSPYRTIAAAYLWASLKKPQTF